MTSWFVSTTRTLVAGAGKEVERRLAACANEQAAKEIASRALVRGLRVQAGTIPGIEPKVRVEWRAAHHWAQSSNDGAIMSLRRRLIEFTGQGHARIGGAAPAESPRA